MNKFASLCLLAYKRPELLKQCLESLYSTIDYPCEVIVNYDGVDDTTYITQKASKIIINNGNNRGVGRSFQNCLGVAEGDYIFKIDTDLTFQPHWLSTAVGILDNNPEVKALGLFDYNKWDPLDSRFQPKNNIIKDHGNFQIVKDFVSSIYGFKASSFSIGDWTEVPDDGLHLSFGTLALKHMVENTAFGVTRSTYVSGTEDKPFKTPTYSEPLLFGKQ